jgi:hypothetical protein
VTRPDVPPWPASVLSERVAAGWRSWHTVTDRRAEVGALLPGLLIDCQDTAQALDEGPERRAAHAALAEAYHLAQHVLVNTADSDLMWLVVDRGMSAAHIADDPPRHTPNRRRTIADH